MYKPITAIAVSLFFFTSCEKKQHPTTDAPKETPAATKAVVQSGDDIAHAEKSAFYKEVRAIYNGRRFKELDAMASDLRKSRQILASGIWKIARFYEAFECLDSEPESMWQLHDKIHKEWLAASPNSVTAHVSYADFLVSYAWQARGSEFAAKVTQEGWRLMKERMDAAAKILVAAQKLPEKDPVLYRVMMTIAMGQSWPRANFDQLTNAATAYEPQFWEYDTARAQSLLPRWQGKPGDWEAYAEQASKRTNGLGSEAYARIVIALWRYYDNVFEETKASWPQTRSGLDQMAKKYPHSIEIMTRAAILARLANDREFARVMLNRIGTKKSPWLASKTWAQVTKWVETGVRGDVSPALAGERSEAK